MMVSSASVFAQETNPEAKTKSFTGENYRVDYAIKDSWGDTQFIEVKLINTGEENIEAFALKYPVQGTIENLWGATATKYGDKYIFVATSYNLVLKPNQTVTYGYKSVGGDMKLPEDIVLSSKRNVVSKNYIIELNKVQDYYDETKYEVRVTNNMEIPIKMWEISFNANFMIKSIWNAEIKKLEENIYTIKSADNNQVIAPKSAITFTFSCAKGSDYKISNEILTSVFAFNSQILLVAMQDDEGNIDLKWLSDDLNGESDVLVSTDGNNFSSVSSTSETSYTYEPDPAISKYYFKVGQTISTGQYFESNIAEVIKGENGFEMVLIDTDEDGIPDIYENAIGTNPNKKDTDGDRLSDYIEIYVTNTDPLKKDTDSNGITDDLDDQDTDGLLNINEVEIGTNPLVADTDEDGLSDGDEVSKYGTDPLKFDTD